MSTMKSQLMRCPICGAEQELTVYECVNVTLNPELRDELFKRRINVFSCRSCGKDSAVKAPMLYHDMKREYCVQFYPPQSMGDPGVLGRFESSGTLKPEGLPAILAGRYLAHPHVVFDMEEMLRYILFREKLKP